MAKAGLAVTPGLGATIAGASHVEGFIQAVAQQPNGRLPIGATYHLVASTAGTLAAPATANHALIRMYPGAAMNWSANYPSVNGTLGMPLMGIGSFPEALELVGSQQLAGFRHAMLAGETTQPKFWVEYSRFVL